MDEADVRNLNEGKKKNIGGNLVKAVEQVEDGSTKTELKLSGERKWKEIRELKVERARECSISQPLSQPGRHNHHLSPGSTRKQYHQPHHNQTQTASRDATNTVVVTTTNPTTKTLNMIA